MVSSDFADPKQSMVLDWWVYSTAISDGVKARSQSSLV